MRTSPSVTHATPITARDVFAGLAVVGTLVGLVLYRRAHPAEAKANDPKPSPKCLGFSVSPSGLVCDEHEAHEGNCYNAASNRSWAGVHDRQKVDAPEGGRVTYERVSRV